MPDTIKTYKCPTCGAKTTNVTTGRYCPNCGIIGGEK